MQLITVSGPPSSGKTSVMANVIKVLQAEGCKVGIVKFDCLTTDDDKLYQQLNVPVRVGLSGNLCPDHYFVSNIDDCLRWGLGEGLDMLISESAGLCNRCSPHIKEVMALCVIDNLMGINTPKKIGPMLKLADLVVITKGDIVSQAEREVFAFRVRRANPRATVLFVSGLTGQGAEALAHVVAGAPDTPALDGASLRFTMPAAVCSYCLGQRKIGTDHQMGNVRKMDFPREPA